MLASRGRFGPMPTWTRARAVCDATQPFARRLYRNFPGFVEDGDKLLQCVLGGRLREA